jgi:hypothetical protein
MSLTKKFATDDVRIKEIKALKPPSDLLDAMQASQATTDNILATRFTMYFTVVTIAYSSSLAHAQFMMNKQDLNTLNVY